MVEKVIRNGMVAVLVSPGYGAGWSTWASDNQAEIAMFHPRFVDACEMGVKNIDDIAKEVFGDDYFYAGGWQDVEIVWLEQGTPFRINEYDGSESLITGTDLYQVA